jgi:hypothetical protein
MGILLSLLPLFPSLINGVELLFHKKPSSGNDKMNAFIQLIQVILSNLEGAGVIPSGSMKNVSPMAIQGAAETILKNMKDKGTLVVPDKDGNISSVPSIVPATLYLLKGTITPLQVQGI